ncbi:MAG: BON domain-containing protein [Chitinophagaceae bacterium]|nr:BON domain-containing protein [Chitinophagaceae bacterium]
MKHTRLRSMLIAGVLATALVGTGCKGKEKAKEPVVQPAADTPQQSTPAPVEISSDDELRNSLKDALKDFPGVNAEVKDGEIILTGTIERARLQVLMLALNSLRPKKITNNLTVK